ncbi:bifunctional metallophosphatase/5'-nucleotidase [Luteipulveratus sp. YIM 133132]|uniref:bifunctional metallophosphatase/5'-nucleotidase n=1 Tax=Luteipulveratus flavus TaxID=3031728 RepID=UPI0023B085BB|nr:bifunctional metallophosphatase/5'-nucleotidase [Luteipulveratus sp. YIM 133132]MDE9365521.1 bifunctional metallophosphatase/5'-nucleotidase [Luteipulveratus sp. YIM 133132]
MTRRLSMGLAAATAAGACAVALALPADAGGADHGDGGTVPIQLLSYNDFHGNLEPPTGSSGRVVVDHKIDPTTRKPVDVTVDAGGAEYMSTHLSNLRQGHKVSYTVTAGDLIGASPLLSAAFHDEKTIDALSMMGTDVSAVGNHEFDEGSTELLRMQRGGCLDDGAGANNQNSCPDGAGTFDGAGFSYLDANVVREDTGETLLPSYTIKKQNGVPVAFVGLTLKETPSIVTAAGVKGLQFTDEVKAANALVPELKRKGVNAMVILIHQGGNLPKEDWTGPDGKTYQVNPTYDYVCGKGGALAPDSPIIPIAKGLDPAYDAIVTGHTHQSYSCTIPDPAGQPRTVTSASSFGRQLTETILPYSRKTKDIVRPDVTTRDVIVTRDVAKDARITDLITRSQAQIAPIANKVLGTITTDVSKTPNAAGESPLGDLIADAQLADPSTVTGGKTPQIAFMNPGGIRADLPYGPDNGQVTFGDAFTVQPFNNYLVSLDLTGADLYALLNQQWSGANAASPKVLQVSKGFTYSWSAATKQVVPGSVRLNGVAVDSATTYRVVTNNFLQGGGDGFAAFTKGAGVYYGGLDIDAFASYLQKVSPYTPGALNRITVQ